VYQAGELSNVEPALIAQQWCRMLRSEVRSGALLSRAYSSNMLHTAFESGGYIRYDHQPYDSYTVLYSRRTYDQHGIT
jgi:hypothetical protein